MLTFLIVFIQKNLYIMIYKEIIGGFTMELLAIPGVGGIIEKTINGVEHILIQERCKEDAPLERGLIEIPAGKIRQFENIFDCLKREIKEETGLEVVKIYGENDATIIESNGYKVLSYSPFACAQNIEGNYPIMVEIFICEVQGDVLSSTNETKNMRWISLSELEEFLINEEKSFYPMHIITLRKYLLTK